MKDIEHIKKKFYLLYNFLIKKHGPAFILDYTKELVDNSYINKDIKRLQKVDKELDVWVREMLLPGEKQEFLSLLKSELNEDSEKELIDQVNRIVTKGKISSKREYEIILQRVESIYTNKEMEEEVTNLNKLLSQFHAKK